MRAISRNEMLYLAGAIKPPQEDTPSSEFLIGATIGGMLSRVLFGSNFAGTFLGALAGGIFVPQLARIGFLPQVSNQSVHF